MSRFHQHIRQALLRGGASAPGLLIAAPAAPPAIGDALDGGYYTGAAWDTVTVGTASIDLATVSVGQSLTLALPDESTTAGLYYPVAQWPFYLGQSVRLAPVANTTQVFIDALVTARTAAGLSVQVAAVTGASGAFDTWVVAARWKVVLAPKSGGESTVNMQYKIESTVAPAECITLTNGRAATAAMIAANIAAGSTIYPAANFVAGVNAAALAGFSDWELPARDWLELIWRNLKPLIDSNFLATRPKSNSYRRDANVDDIATEPRGLNRHSVPPGGGYTAEAPARTALAAFVAGGAQAMATNVAFWSSSEYSATGAWIQLYTTSTPGNQTINGKTNGNRVRAVRRSIL